MATLIEIAKEVFTAESWSFKVAVDRPLLEIPFEGQNGRFMCYAQVQEAQHRLVFFSMWPAPVPADRRTEVAEFLMRVNMQLAVANFEIDFDGGELRCRTSIDVENSELTPALLKNIAHANVLVMDTYSPGIKAVVTGSAPKAAFARVQAIVVPK